MNTDKLIRVLAMNASSPPPAALSRRLAMAACVGVFVSAVAAVAGLGPSADLHQGGYATAMKLGFTLAVVLVCIDVLLRHTRPGSPRQRPWNSLNAVLVTMGIAGLILWLENANLNLHDAVFGQSWASCPQYIVALSLPSLLLILVLLRGRPTVTPARTGAVAGLAAGALGAAGYALHCGETSPWFVLIWYGLSMLIPTALGAWLGARWLRW